MKNCFKALAFGFLCIFGVHTAFAQCTASLFAGGAGTEASPYQISTAQQLQNLNQCLGESYRNNHYVLNNDIDLSSYLQGAGNNSGAGWQPIGYTPGSFYSKFNGNGHKVSGLWINRPAATYVGLFGIASEIRNIGIEIDDGRGGIVGGSFVGGLVGRGGTIISNSYTTGNVSGNTFVGGLVGFHGGTVSGSYATGSVTGSGESVGGLVGYNNDGTVSGSYAIGSVTGSVNVGGLVGYNDGTVSNSYAAGSVKGTGTRSNNGIGGLVGYSGTRSKGTIRNSYAMGNVSGYGYIGGLVCSDGIISNSYYDKETTSGTCYGIGKSTAEMKTQSTYQDWDFEGIWEISPEKNSGYPTLLWQNPEHIGSAIVTIMNQTWTGSPITPKPSVSFKGNNLIVGTDFEYAYDNNVQIGTATMKIIGKGNYSGQTKIVEFRITTNNCGEGFAGGMGTEADPYKIMEAKNLDAINNCLYAGNSNKYYELQKDIDLGNYLANSSAGWQPIGNIDSDFYGKLNGNGHKVSGLWINKPAANYVGLFGYAYSSAEIRNIGIEINDGKGGVRGYNDVGGLVGYNSGGTISNSYATGSVTGIGRVGGLVGSNVENSSSGFSGTISNSYATGSVTGSSNVGGLVGRNGNGWYNNNGDGRIISSYATGSVTGSSSVGGLAGSNSGTVSNSYATSNVTGNSGNVGGLVGVSSQGTIINSYATGNVTSNSGNVGGLVGYYYSGDGRIISSYYDKETTSRMDTGKGIGKNTTEMKMQSTYQGWDFENIWEINSAKNSGYPTLLWQNLEHIGNAIVAISNQTWTGSPITPKPSVSFKGSFLNEGMHFEYVYSDNIQIGTATLRIVGKGIYSGQAKVTEFKIVPAACGTGFTKGTGTEADPYKIADAKNLDAINNCLGYHYPDRYYELQNDIDLSDYLANSSIGWQPIGYDGLNYFSGKFNGNGHNVSGLWINRLVSYVGLFGNSNGGEIKNIGVSIDNGKGGVRGSNYVGGLAGYNAGTVSNSYATGSVTGTNCIGGLAGYNGNSATAAVNIIINSYATGSVTGSVTGSERGVGGLAGCYRYPASTVSGSYYNKETSGQTDALGTSKTTSEMKTQSTYQSWDFQDTWTIVNIENNGYPILKWQLQNKIEYAIVSYIPSKSYTGSIIEPTFTVTLNETTLTKNADYTVSYSNNRNAGTAKITVTGLGKYLGSIEAYFTITAKPVTITNITITASNKEYDGNATAHISGTAAIIGEIHGDVVNVTGSASFDNKNVGNHKTVTFTNLALIGTDAGNYTLSAQPEPVRVTANITAKPVTITGITTSNKEYDGNATATVIGTAAVNEVIGSDAVTITNGNASFNNEKVGTNKTVTFSGYSLSGTDASNYTLSSQPSSITANITSKPVTITDINIADKEYDGTTTATVTGNMAVNGKIDGDVVTVARGSASFNDKNAGNDKIVTFSGFSLGGTDANNYTLSSQPSCTANITAKTLAITGISVSNKEYDGTTTATVTGKAAVSGKIGSDDVTVIPGIVSFNNKNAGNDKAMTLNNFSLSGTDAHNYTFSAQPANITANITAKPVTISGISTKNKVYDGTTTATIAGTAIINGAISDDDVDVTNGTASFADINTGISKTVTFSNFKLGGTDASNYTLTAQPKSVAANITAKPVTITGITALDKEYDGTTTVTITGTAVVSEKISDDDLTVIPGTASFANKNAGISKTVTFNGYWLTGADAGNYVLAAQPSVTANITPKPITITDITALDKEYDGTTTVEFTGGELIGALSGDAVNFKLGTGTIASPDIGSNKTVSTNITLTGADAPNYTLTQPTGITVEIKKPTETPTFPNRENPQIGQIGVQTINNAILLSNLPQNAKVEVYNLQGKRIYSAHPENPKILRIGVQTKGIYIVKVGTQTMRVAVR